MSSAKIQEYESPSVLDLLGRELEAALQAAGFDPIHAVVTLSDRPDLAHYQSNAAMICAKALKKNPREVAQKISEILMGVLKSQGIEIKIAGPGFLNFILSDEVLARWVQARADSPSLGVSRRSNPKKVVIDFGGPNVAKELHAGHLRSSIIGDSLVKIFRFLGDSVVGDNHLGDWGTPMGMLLVALSERKPELSYFKSDYFGPFEAESPVSMGDLEEMYPLASKRFKEDEVFQSKVLKATEELQKGRKGYVELWRHFVATSRRAMEKDFADLGIQFDEWMGESFYEDKMPQMVERLKNSGIAQLSQGALVIHLASPEDPELAPLILVKSGGGFLYHTSDLATVQYRVDEMNADLVLYVVDKRQSLHFKQVFLAARKSGIQKDAALEHLAFGTMNGPDGKPFKTRTGGVIKLRELMALVNGQARKRLTELGVEHSVDDQERISRFVGIATLKYADLKGNLRSDYIFDVEKFSEFEGQTGPYLLYAAVRIKSILRKAKELGLYSGRITASRGVPQRLLQLELIRFEDILRLSYARREPHHLCEYGFQLAQAFNFFYKESHILNEADKNIQASWLTLSGLTLRTLEKTLELLGIQVPEKM